MPEREVAPQPHSSAELLLMAERCQLRRVLSDLLRLHSTSFQITGRWACRRPYNAHGSRTSWYSSAGAALQSLLRSGLAVRGRWVEGSRGQRRLARTVRALDPDRVPHA